MGRASAGDGKRWVWMQTLVCLHVFQVACVLCCSDNIVDISEIFVTQFRLLVFPWRGSGGDGKQRLCMQASCCLLAQKTPHPPPPFPASLPSLALSLPPTYLKNWAGRKGAGVVFRGSGLTFAPTLVDAVRAGGRAIPMRVADLVGSVRCSSWGGEIGSGICPHCDNPQP